MIRKLTLPATLALTLALLGCEQRATAPAEAPETAQAAAPPTLPDGFFLDSAPADPRGVAEIKADTAASEVVLVGRIGGRVSPFVDGAAMFVVADLRLKHCGELHADQCPTPWDYCCEPKDSLTAHTATVQVVDDAGRPLAIDLQGQGGLEPLKPVIVTGKVASREGSALVITADGLYVEPAAG